MWYVPRRTFLVFHVEHFLCSNFQREHFDCSAQDISRVPKKTFPVAQAGYFLCSKKDISCVPNKNSRVFQREHVVCPTGCIPCVLRRTFPVFRSPKIHMPLFGEFSRSSWDLCKSLSDSQQSSDDRLNSPKSGMLIFLIS